MRFPSLVCVVVFGLSAGSFAQSRSASTDRSSEVGMTFVRHLSQGRYAEAAGMVDDSVKAQMNTNVLKGVWTNISEGKGEFRNVGTPTVTNLVMYKWVLVPCEWVNGRIRLRVVVNSQRKVVGLFVVPPALKSAGVRPPYLHTEVTIRDITVGKAPWSLPGTLTLPKSGKPKGGVVLVHGSGPNDRDETLGPNKPFRDLALGLAEKGIATLRYDKRTYAHKLVLASKLALKGGITVDEEVVDDALAGLNVLRAQPELANVPVYVLGHSVGAILAPEIAAKDGKVAGAVLLAGPARPMEDVMVDQLTYLDSPDVGQVRQQMEGIRKHTLKPDDKVMSAPAAYWYDLCGRDAEVAVKTAAGLNCRILVVQGGRDYQSTTDDFKLWQAALGKRPKATLKLFEDLNHLFAAGEGKATPDEYNDETHVDARVIDLIAAWCVEPGGVTTRTSTGSR
ncbi:MAG TPA: alpha/beta fold hydrolase [Phycisphaerae bacterium]|nr:alpha/beta fold hydrolase [Phycisphaerae bacterium]HRY70633.1 alpha/beta fold hydrolase [Phycisphaerae bacterium]HSA28947.1 alpha/beta fold hydrolase [Phycisphaerae bacterium]